MLEVNRIFFLKVFEGPSKIVSEYDIYTISLYLKTTLLRNNIFLKEEVSLNSVSDDVRSMPGSMLDNEKVFSS
jgi:hypothetical protein